MNIILDSTEVLYALYRLLNDNSSVLMVDVCMDDMAKELNMTKEHLNCCIHYLILSEYINGDVAYSTQENFYKRITFTASGIIKCESNA